MSTPLFAVIRDEILSEGPIGLDRYMALCLGHPVHGYYRTRDPLGRGGDFITAPEISQMFGELIGVWIAATWDAMGRPANLALVELGPGRGTLMSDALRALTRAAPGLDARIHLVEISPVLKAVQAQRLGMTPIWHDGIESLPDGPAIVIANEFFDALPVRQFQRTDAGWSERRVGLSFDLQRLVFGLAPDPSIRADAPVGVLTTIPGAALDLARHLGRRLREQGGALLAFDYGHARPAFGDTLQAVAGHRFVDPLASPGEADLTTHVDFTALARAAASGGARIHGPVDQRDFLVALGLHTRADRLRLSASDSQGEAIDAAVTRLTDPSHRGMGSLFKVLGVSGPNLADLPALSSIRPG